MLFLTNRPTFNSVTVLSYQDGPLTRRIKIFPMAVDPQHRYLNEAERAEYDVNDDFKLKKPSIALPKISHHCKS